MYDQRDSLNSSKDEYKYKLTKKGKQQILRKYILPKYIDK